MRDPTEVAGRYYAALSTNDSVAVSETLSPACTVHVPGAELEGREQVQGWMQSFFDAFPDIEHERGELARSGDTVETDLRIRGTHEAPLVSPDGQIPATGKRVEFTAHNVLRVEGDHISELTISYDPVDFMRQLGIA